MVTRELIDDFLALDSFAVVGVSRSGKKFGNSVYRMLKERGKEVYPVNRLAEKVDGERCYAYLRELPDAVDGVVIVVRPQQAETVLKEAAEAGIRRVWIQQGSESKKSIQFCEQYGLQAVYGQCIIMYSDPVESIHKFHRWCLKVLGKLPL